MVATVYESVDAALEGIEDGISLMIGGFASAGSPGNLLQGLIRRGTRGLTVIANNVIPDTPLDAMCDAGQVDHLIATFAIRASGAKKTRFEEMYREGRIGIEMVPQGTFAERIRAGGAGIPGFLTPTAVGTSLAEGKSVIALDGRDYLLERALTADVAVIRAHRADRLGNLEYRDSGRNFNPLMATAARLVIAEVEEIVEPGEIDPNHIVTPAVYVDRLVQCPALPVRWDG